MRSRRAGTLSSPMRQSPAGFRLVIRRGSEPAPAVGSSKSRRLHHSQTCMHDASRAAHRLPLGHHPGQATPSQLCSNTRSQIAGQSDRLYKPPANHAWTAHRELPAAVSRDSAPPVARAIYKSRRWRHRTPEIRAHRPWNFSEPPSRM